LVLPALLRMRHRPKFTIYYLLESLSYYAHGSTRRSKFMLDLNRRAAPLLDLLIFSEENRAAADLDRGGLRGIPLVVCYNAVNRLSQNGATNHWEGRKRCLLYSGTIHRELTVGDYFVRDEIAKLPIDLWGLVEGPGKAELEAALSTRGGAVRYRGYVDSLKLAELRKEYAYSLVIWAPIDENFHYACPNKFFEAIADGVPPIAAPHPQCRMLLDRYDCGIAMDDWSFPAFRAAIVRAMKIFGTPRYSELVVNCRRAAAEELNWDRQFEKVARLLPESL
jgi:hypothetical protein